MNMRIPNRPRALVLSVFVLAGTAAAQTVPGYNPIPVDPPPLNGAGAVPAWQAQLMPSPNIEINLATGNVLFKFMTSNYEHAALEPHHGVMLYFNSLAASKPDATGELAIGDGWSSSVGGHLDFPSNGYAVLTLPDGREVQFWEITAGTWVAMRGSFLELEPDGTQWIVRTREQWEYRYGAAGRLKEITSANDNASIFQFSAGQMTYTGEPSGRGATFAYRASGELETITDSGFNEWTLGYDAAGKLQTIEDPDHGTVTLGWDAGDRINSVTDLGGHTWLVGYHGAGPWLGRVASLTHPTGDAMQIDWEQGPQNVRTLVTDLRGGVWRYIHDQEQSPALVRIKNPSLHTWKFTHDRDRLLLSRTNPLSSSWTWDYDNNGNLTNATDPRSVSIDYGYDALNNLTSIVEGGETTTFHYEDPAHPTQVTRIVQPADESGFPGTSLLTYYGPNEGTVPGQWNGLLHTVTDAEGVETRLEYSDAALWVAEHEGPVGATGGVEARLDLGAEFSYVDLGGATVPAGHPAVPGLPGPLEGRLDRSIPSSMTWSWRGAWQDLGFTIDVPIDSGAGQEFSSLSLAYTHDHMGRLLTSSETTEEVFAHVASPPATPSTRTFSAMYHDAAPDGRVEITTPDGDVVRYLHDQDSRLVRVETNGGGGGELWANYTHFTNGALESVTRNDGTSTHYTYLANGLVDTIEHRSGATVRLHIDHDYDGRNLPITVTEVTPADIVTKTYAYDSRKQLISEEWASSAVTLKTAYTYDQVGNRTRVDRFVDGALVGYDIYHTDGENPAAHSSDNNRLSWIETFDGAGQPVSSMWFYHDNPFGNVSRIVGRDAGSTSFASAVFVYTEEGRPWLSWTETWDDTGSGPANVARGDVFETRQTGASSRLLRRRDGQTFAPIGTAEWVTGMAGVRAAFAVDPQGGSVLPTELRVQGLGRLLPGGLETQGYDALGSVRWTASAGAFVDQDYTAFGATTTATSEDFGFAGGFGAQQAFGGSPLGSPGLVKMGYRFLMPELGRFTMRDPLGISDGPNVYAFVHNRPTALIDPLGLAAQGGDGGGGCGCSCPCCNRSQSDNPMDEAVRIWKEKNQNQRGNPHPGSGAGGKFKGPKHLPPDPNHPGSGAGGKYKGPERVPPDRGTERQGPTPPGPSPQPQPPSPGP